MGPQQHVGLQPVWPALTMGQIDLPQYAVAKLSAQKAAAEAIPADLTDCRSPLSSQWESSTSFFLSADNDQKRLQPTELDPIPTTIPDTFTFQQPYRSDGDQISMQRMEAHPVPALFPAATALQQAHLPTAPVGFATEPMPWVDMMPMVMPQQHVGLQPVGVSELGFSSNQTDVFASASEFGQSCTEPETGDALDLDPDFAQASTEVGDADNYTAEGIGPHLSASQARRRRRNRAATLRAQQGVHNESDRRQADKLKMSFAKDSRWCKMSCSEMLARLKTGGEGLPAVLAEIIGLARHLTFEAEGCRVVQLALQEADHQDRTRLCAELHGCVRRAVASPHGNYVIQRVVELMPATLSSFVSSEILGVGAEIARHRFGCRILCRLLEHSSTQPSTIQLINETLSEARELCCHSYAHHVMESVLEHGTADQKHWIALVLQADPLGYATDAHAPYVIESALRNCSLVDRRAIGAAFLADKDGVLFLAEHTSGIHVVRALRNYSEQSSSIAALLQEKKCRLQSRDNGSALSHQAA